MSVNISGLEANFLLFALDKYVETDKMGKVTKTSHGYSKENIQYIRDKLFMAHEHPQEKE